MNTLAWIVGSAVAMSAIAWVGLMEQFLSWHHGHSASAVTKQPVTYLILLADGLHNFIGGLALGASFIVSTEVGEITWIAAAAHEVHQELGDFGILVRGGGATPRARRQFHLCGDDPARSAIGLWW